MNEREQEILRKKIGEKIKIERIKNNISQIEVESMLGFTKTTMSKIERGESCFTLYNIIEICKLFNISLDSIIFEQNNINK